MGTMLRFRLTFFLSFVFRVFECLVTMLKFLGVATKSDDELLSLSSRGLLFKDAKDGLGPLRSCVKDQTKLKEREARAEVLARNCQYVEAAEIENSCTKLRTGLAFGQREYENARSALRLAMVS
jgi:hypothetical protein